MLSDKQVEEICLFWDNDASTCRYIDQDDDNPDKFYCMKCRPVEKVNIDAKVAQYLKECKLNGVSPVDAGKNIGNNCPGYPYLRHKVQGFDQKM